MQKPMIELSRSNRYARFNDGREKAQAHQERRKVRREATAAANAAAAAIAVAVAQAQDEAQARAQAARTQVWVQAQAQARAKETCTEKKPTERLSFQLNKPKSKVVESKNKRLKHEKDADLRNALKGNRQRECVRFKDFRGDKRALDFQKKMNETYTNEF